MLAAFHEKKEVVLALWKYQQSMSTLRICKHCLLRDCHEIILSWARPLASLSTHTAPAAVRASQAWLSSISYLFLLLLLHQTSPRLSQSKQRNFSCV